MEDRGSRSGGRGGTVEEDGAEKNRESRGETNTQQKNARIKESNVCKRFESRLQCEGAATNRSRPRS